MELALPLWLQRLVARLFGEATSYAYKKLKKALAKAYGRGGFRNMVLLVGESGVGKTTLIRSITGNPLADPSVSTVDFHLYGTEFTISKRGSNNTIEEHQINVSVADYRGQHIGTLFKGLNDAIGPHALSEINTLVLLVDLFPPEKDALGRYYESGAKYDTPDEARIRHNLDHWSNSVLQMIFGLLNRNALQNICLFINKVDLLKDHEARERAQALYQPLISKLHQWGGGIDGGPRILLGSTLTGEGLNILRNDIISNAVEIEGRAA